MVNLTLQYALALQLSQETAHTALALMDRCVLAGMQIPDQLQPVLVCTCLRIAAIQESACLLTPYQVQTVTQIPGQLLPLFFFLITVKLSNYREPTASHSRTQNIQMIYAHILYKSVICLLLHDWAVAAPFSLGTCLNLLARPSDL